MSINELKAIIGEMIEQSEEYREKAKGSFDKGYEQGWYDALVEVMSKL